MAKQHYNQRVGEKNGMWKGDDVGIPALHDWVKDRMPKPEYCEHCGLAPPRDLANKSGKYKRALTDWYWICRRCHMVIDGRLEKLRERIIAQNKAGKTG